MSRDNRVLKVDDERIDFLIRLLENYQLKPNEDNNNIYIAFEILQDLRILDIDIDW